MKYDFLIGTVRFNNKTYIENIEWKKRKNFTGCAYGLDKKISPNVNLNKTIYVIEMNNSINKIMGIGKIKNKSPFRSRMYKEERFNKFIYKSKNFINRLDIIKYKFRGEIVLKFLENILFRGYSHFKRGQGCIILPWDRILTTGQTVKKINKINKNKCAICGKTKKGHICNVLKKNIELEKFIYNWFNNLFIQQYHQHSQ